MTVDGDQQTTKPDTRITVIDARRQAPPCKVAIWSVPLFGVWVGKCECGHWRSSLDAANAFGWFTNERKARASAEKHLAKMDEYRETNQ